jgi:hypothetical protein
MEKIEYRVRPVTRYVVTHYKEDTEAKSASVGGLGEYDNELVAYEVAYALCKAEHERKGWPPGDERITYPALVRVPRDLSSPDGSPL